MCPVLAVGYVLYRCPWGMAPSTPDALSAACVECVLQPWRRYNWVVVAARVRAGIR